jgi:hypothetical protein
VSADQDAATGPEPSAGPAQLRMRRAPRYRAFGLTGAGLGVALGIILALVLEVSDAASATSTGADYSTRSVAGYFLAIFGLLGLAIGLGLAVLIERRSA